MLMSFVLLEVEELVVSTKLWPCAWVWLAFARNPRNLDFSDSARSAHPRRKRAVGSSTRSGYRSRATQHHGPSAQKTSSAKSLERREEHQASPQGLTALTEALRELDDFVREGRPACGQSAARARTT